MMILVHLLSLIPVLKYIHTYYTTVLNPQSNLFFCHVTLSHDLYVKKVAHTDKPTENESPYAAVSPHLYRAS